MKNINPEGIFKSKYLLLIVAVFLVIFFSRFLFLSSDLPRIHDMNYFYGTDVEIEEKPGGFNARNMVVSNRWALYQNWFQPMVYVPLQSFISYWSFRLFGVGLAQFRFPPVLAGFLGLVVFYLILLKQTNRALALLGLLFYAFIFEITVWNRSALPENLYLLFMPLAVYFLTKEHLRDRDLFALVFFAALNVVVKLDGYPFYLATGLFLLAWSVVTKSFGRIFKAGVLGSLAASVVLLLLFGFMGSFKYISPMYRFYFGVFGTGAAPLGLSQIALSLRKLAVFLIRVDPYMLLAFLSAIPGLAVNYARLKKADWFMILFLIVLVITRLSIPIYLLYWKRAMLLFFPAGYLIVRSLFLLWEGKGVPRTALVSLTLSFVLASLVINSLKTTKIYLPENIRYSYQENEKYAELIPKGEMIVSHEQGFRALVYLDEHDFYYNHDGGPNPIAHREILERRDLRYFILNVEEFWRSPWGIPNKVRLEMIKESYPDLKLLGVFSASRIPLAIYDKYGSNL